MVIPLEKRVQRVATKTVQGLRHLSSEDSGTLGSEWCTWV